VAIHFKLQLLQLFYKLQHAALLYSSLQDFGRAISPEQQPHASSQVSKAQRSGQ
jgi:hypothetical protein